MSKVRTNEQPAPEHTHATEFKNKVEAGAKAAQVHAEVVKHSYESALNVESDDAPDADDEDARGTEVGAPGAGANEGKSPSFDR
jgi:hypothetical protein